MKTPDAYTTAATKLLQVTGLAVVLDQALEALTSVLFVVCSTEVEAADLYARTLKENRGDRLIEHWKARREAAHSIRRHADKLEAAVRLLWKLVPAETVADKSGREELKAMLRKAKALKP